MSAMPETAMLLAAGLGTRMRPLTLTQPKPLIPVAGKALIDWTLDALAEVGVRRAVVNVHHHADQMRAHLTARTATPRIVISDETEQLLDTGGGLAKARPLLGNAPFYVCNCDSILAGGARGSGAFQRLADAWNDAALDVVMLVHPTATAHGFDGPGDFYVEADGTMTRRGTSAHAPFVYAGVWIAHPRILASLEAVPFSANRLWDKALAANRMKAVVHDGEWFHVGTPEAVPATTALLTRRSMQAALAP